MSGMSQTSGMENDDKFIKLTKQKEKRSLICNQTVMRVSTIVTTKHEEVEYYPMPDNVLLTHRDLYKYEKKGRNLIYRMTNVIQNENTVKKIKPFPKNDADEANMRFISQTRSKYTYKIIGMSFLETATRLFNDMIKSAADYYDRDNFTFFHYVSNHLPNDADLPLNFQNTGNISDDDYYELIQNIL